MPNEFNVISISESDLNIVPIDNHENDYYDLEIDGGQFVDEYHDPAPAIQENLLEIKVDSSWSLEKKQDEILKIIGNAYAKHNAPIDGFTGKILYNLSEQLAEALHQLNKPKPMSGYNYNLSNFYNYYPVNSTSTTTTANWSPIISNSNSTTSFG